MKIALNKLPILLAIKEKLMNARPTSFGDAIKAALSANRMDKALAMVKDQVNLGNIESVEWCVGASTLTLIDKLNT